MLAFVRGRCTNGGFLRGKKMVKIPGWGKLFELRSWLLCECVEQVLRDQVRKLPFQEEVVRISHHSQIVKLDSLILEIPACKCLEERERVAFIYKEKFLSFESIKFYSISHILPRTTWDVKDVPISKYRINIRTFFSPLLYAFGLSAAATKRSDFTAFAPLLLLITWSRTWQSTPSLFFQR